MLLVTNFDDFYGRGIPGTGKCCIDAKVLEKEYYEYGISLSTTLSSMVELIGTAVAAAIIAVIWNFRCNLRGYDNIFCCPH